MAKLVSKAYGQALFELAVEEKIERVLLEEISAVQLIFQENPDFVRFIKHPGIAKQEKIKVTETVFKGRVSEELTGFLKLLITKDRFGELQAIFAYFTEKVKEAEKIGVAYVSTAVELTQDQKKKVCERLLATTGYESVELHYSVDPALIGGMVIRINDRVVDSSIRTKLKNMTKQLLV